MGVELATGEEAPDAAMRGRRRKRPIAIAGAVLVILIGTATWFFVLRPSGPSAATKLRAQTAQSGGVTTVVETPELIVNLDAGPHRVSFAKLQLGFEVEQTSDAVAIRSAMPRIVDMTETYVRSIRPEELRSDTGAYLLREALLSRMAVVAPTAQVGQVLFEELLVQ